MGVSLTGDKLATSRPKKGALASQALIPTCKLCRVGVQAGEERVWLRKPMGISHAACAANRTDIVRV